MKKDVLYYTEPEMNAVERHITKHFGEIGEVYHEKISQGLHVDICVVEPTPEKNWYTLVTMGMGAHKMALPEGLQRYRRPRAELFLRLPGDWKIHGLRSKWRWPLFHLADLARYPLLESTFLSAGHTVDMQRPLGRKVPFSGSVLVPAEMPGCLLPSMEMVDFYEVIPLYPRELEYKRLFGLDPLMDRLETQPEPCRREDTVPREELDRMEPVLDLAQWHLDAIGNKGLKVEEIAAYNHMAMLLRWFVEQGLMGRCFGYMYPDFVAEVLEKPMEAEIREFIRNALCGVISRGLFSPEGAAFSVYATDPEPGGRFPDLVDSYAEAFFGTERYHSEEFQNEAYLFLPYDEDYYRAVKTGLDRLYETWKQA